SPFQPRPSALLVSPQRMPCPHPAVPSPPLALAGWSVLWDWVTLTCQDSGTTGATTWNMNGRRWWQNRGDQFTVTRSGTYRCDRSGTGWSPPVRVFNGEGGLGATAWALLEGDKVTLRCWQDSTVTGVRFYHEEQDLGGCHDGTQISLFPLQLHHSGHYHCRGWVGAVTPQWKESQLVTVTVRSECRKGNRQPQHPPRVSPPLPESFIPAFTSLWVTQNFPSSCWFLP
uniref:Ig-like domain-containing protein n=1 Tax=Zosterops lateralis melanops TaxID=1220523 RepID=A0A8D2PJ78_ZOSLA